MSILTAGRWIWLPTPGSGAERLAANRSGCAGTFQVLCSNGTLAARENSLRTLWEDRGSESIYFDLLSSLDPASVIWGAEDASGAYVRYAGIHRVRPWGESGRLPRIELRARGAAPVGQTLGVMLAVCAPEAPPDAISGQYAYTTTTSATIVDLAATVEHYPVTRRESAPRDVSTRAVLERGGAPYVALWVAAWCTSGSDAAKAALYGLTVSLRPPSPDL